MNEAKEILTKRQLWREVKSLKELLIDRIESVEKTVDIAHEDLVRVPTDVQKQVSYVKEYLEARIETGHSLKEEKFSKVYQMFELIERQRLEQKQDTALNVEKALSSAERAVREQNASNKESITKSETSTSKQLESLNEKINDVRDRTTKIESVTSGISSAKTEQKTSIGLIAAIVFGVFGTIVGIVSVCISFYMINKH